MGKITTIYLSDAEARRLREFCDENQCTQYSALKTAMKQLISRDNRPTSEVGMTQARAFRTLGEHHFNHRVSLVLKELGFSFEEDDEVVTAATMAFANVLKQSVKRAR